ncbi:MAG: imidazoleglycerol-phosphate dehydratase HisB [Deltaproteobacteria bacterium]|nr:imidazoleglycerol-phosphate dehydratase HisB [Deltaproteobacteria bacterium]
MRKAKIERKTLETGVELELVIDGSGEHDISTGIPFFDHMLTHIAKHGFFDLKVAATGDTEVDFHHSVEDIGICLGQAFKTALDGCKGIARYGSALVPMDEALVSVAIDIGGRPSLVFNADIKREKVGDFDTELVEEFLKAFSNHLGCNLHVNALYGSNAHHIIEAIFKSLAKALDAATTIDKRVKGVLSTKGKL